jgi:hypothetical protein
VLAGANFAKLTGDGIGDVKSRTGFVGGISADFHMSSNFGVEIDALYSQEGTKFSGDGDATLKLDYVRVPVLLRLSVPTHSTIHPFFVAGPSLGFKASCKESGGGDSTDCSDTEGADVKSFDFAGAVGAGVGFGMGTHEFSVQGRFTKGFTDIIKDSKIKNQNFSVMAGISF